ncbi:uncharacterized protein BDZ83DRAFT_636227 [Colletotrichum acutatum]|uniref:Uncharacterized protein n=1 Tax=Glomerella acutata TaxID=27357 RepID=A0AAD8XCW2_GLOAC|nr:uncharacterized protein BDZ83DRAFT_636227 [Colletotrichum acutatum]KAK1714955.1 hypothetical protein BDZ83DRAFT_636227 [Colletotrichum acutatum]
MTRYLLIVSQLWKSPTWNDSSAQMSYSIRPPCASSPLEYPFDSPLATLSCLKILYRPSSVSSPTCRLPASFSSFLLVYASPRRFHVPPSPSEDITSKRGENPSATAST